MADEQPRRSGFRLPPDRSQSILGDLPKFVERGARSLVGSLGAIPEAAGAATGIQSLEAAGQRFRQSQQQFIQQQLDPSLSDTGRAVANASFVDDVINGDVPLVPFVAAKTAETIPGTLAGAGVGAGLSRALPGVNRGLLFAAGEAAVSAPGGGAQQAANIDNLTVGQLLQQSDEFRGLYEKYRGLPDVEREAAARSDLKAKAITTGALGGGAAVLAGSALAGKLIKGGTGGVFDDAAGEVKGVIDGIRRGTRQEAVQEAAQGALESVASNLTTGRFTDPEASNLDNLLIDALKDAAEGAVIGGAAGGSIGAVQGIISKSANRKAEEIAGGEPTGGEPTGGAAQPPGEFDINQFTRSDLKESDLQGLSRSDLVSVASAFDVASDGVPTKTLRTQVANAAAQSTKFDPVTPTPVDTSGTDRGQLMALSPEERVQVAEANGINLLDGMSKEAASSRIFTSIPSRQANVPAPYEEIDPIVTEANYTITSKARQRIEETLKDAVDPISRKLAVAELQQSRFGRGSDTELLLGDLSRFYDEAIVQQNEVSELAQSHPDVAVKQEVSKQGERSNPDDLTASEAASVQVENPADVAARENSVSFAREVAAVDVFGRSKSKGAEAQDGTGPRDVEATQPNQPTADVTDSARGLEPSIQSRAQPESQQIQSVDGQRTLSQQPLPDFHSVLRGAPRSAVPLPQPVAAAPSVTPEAQVVAIQEQKAEEAVIEGQKPDADIAGETESQQSLEPRRLMRMRKSDLIALAEDRGLSTSDLQGLRKVDIIDRVVNGPVDAGTAPTQEPAQEAAQESVQTDVVEQAPPGDDSLGTPVEFTTDKAIEALNQVSPTADIPARVNDALSTFKKQDLIKIAKGLGIESVKPRLKKAEMKAEILRSVQDRVSPVQDAAGPQDAAAITGETESQRPARKRTKEETIQAELTDKSFQEETDDAVIASLERARKANADVEFSAVEKVPEREIDRRVASMIMNFTPSQEVFITQMMRQQAQFTADRLRDAAERNLSAAEFFEQFVAAVKNKKSAETFHSVQDAISDADNPVISTNESLFDEMESLDAADASEYTSRNMRSDEADSNDLRASIVRRADKTSGAGTTKMVSDAIRKLQTRGAFKINVIQSAKQLPEVGRQYVADNNLGPHIRGLFIAGRTPQQDQIFLIADNISTPREAVVVAMHEAAHRGLRKVLGAKFAKTLKRIESTNREVRDQVDRLVASENLTRLEATEEVLADMARDGVARRAALWDTVTDFVNNFLIRIGVLDKGEAFRYSNRMVEEMVAGAKKVGLEADTGIVGGTTQGPYTPVNPDIRASRLFSEGPAQAMDRADGILKTVVGFVQNNTPAVVGMLHRKNLYFSTASHIYDFYGRLLGGRINTVLAGMKNTSGRVSAMVAKMDKDIAQAVKKIDALPEKQQRVLYDLMGESTRLGIYPNKPFEDQPWLPKTNRQDYNALRKMYNKPGIRETYDALLAHNQRDFDMTYATLLRNLAFVYGVPDALWRAVDPIKALSSKVLRTDLDNRIKQVEDYINTQATPDAAAALKQMKDFRSSRLQGPYFHLGRFGDFFVRYKVNSLPVSRSAVRQAFDARSQKEAAIISEGANEVMMRFESEHQWNVQQEILRQLAADGHINDLQVGKLEKNLSDFDAASPTFVQNMLARIDGDSRIPKDHREETKELIRRTFVEMMPEIVGSKALARRRGVPGYSADMRRSFVRKSKAVTFFTSHTTVRPEVVQGMQGLRREINAMQGDPDEDPRRTDLAVDLLNHLKLRQDNSLNPIHSPNKDALSAVGYSMFLASNIPYIIANLAQPFQVTLPVVGGRFGFNKTAGAMFTASKLAGNIVRNTLGQGWVDGKGWRGWLDADLIIGRTELSNGQRRALRSLIDSGLIEFTQAHGLARIEQGQNETLGTAAKAAGMMSHYSEALNRITAGLTAYNLEFERLTSRGVDQDRAQATAVEYAADTITKTQFNYDPENRGYAFSKRGIFGELTPLFTAFQQFNMQMLQLLSELVVKGFSNSQSEAGPARRALAGMLATSTVLAGVMGLPFMSVIAAVYNGLGDEDDPRDLRLDVQNFFADMFGADASQLLTHGPLDRLTGGTFSTRLSLADIVPFSRFFEDRRDFIEKIDSGALGMMGPSIGAIMNIVNGGLKIADGEVFKGMSLMLPAALQGPVKALDMGVNGYTDFYGNQLPLEMTNWDLFLQSLNITPAVKTELQRNTRSFRALERELRGRKQELGRKMADALEKGDTTEINKIGAEITNLVATNPHIGQVDVKSILEGKNKQLDAAIITGTGVKTSDADLNRLIQLLQGSTSTTLRNQLGRGGS